MSATFQASPHRTSPDCGPAPTATHRKEKMEKREKTERGAMRKTEKDLKKLQKEAPKGLRSWQRLDLQDEALVD